MPSPSKTEANAITGARLFRSVPGASGVARLLGGGISLAALAGPPPLPVHAQTPTDATPAVASAAPTSKRLPLFARGNEGDRPGLYLTVSASVTDGSGTFASGPRRILLDTGSSGLNLPITWFNFPGGVLPASYGQPVRLMSFTDSTLWGVRVEQATVTLGSGGSESAAETIVIREAPLNIVTQRCVAGRCGSADVGYGIIGVNYQDASRGSNVLRWADPPFQQGFLITTNTRDLASANGSAQAETTPIGALHLGPFQREGFRTVDMVQTGTLARPLPTGSPEAIWSLRLPGACLRIGASTYGSASTTQAPAPLPGPARAGDCKADVVTDSGGRGGMIHFPGPLPRGVRPRNNGALAVVIPGVLAFSFPIHPQPFPIRSFMGARNPNLSINTGYRFFNDYDVFYDPIQGTQGFRPKGGTFAGTP